MDILNSIQAFLDILFGRSRKKNLASDEHEFVSYHGSRLSAKWSEQQVFSCSYNELNLP